MYTSRCATVPKTRVQYVKNNDGKILIAFTANALRRQKSLNRCLVPPMHFQIQFFIGLQNSNASSHAALQYDPDVGEPKGQDSVRSCVKKLMLLESLTKKRIEVKARNARA